jgi:hypothetical protein
MNFKEYMERFEQEVIVPGFEAKILGNRKEEVVPIRNGKLVNTDFGAFIDRTFFYNGMLSINYYGLFKLSSGIITATANIKKIFPDIRSIKAPVVHFNSIKIEQIKEISPEVFNLFPEFRTEVIRLRWGK